MYIYIYIYIYIYTVYIYKVRNSMQNAVYTVNNTLIFQSDTHKHVDSKQTEPLIGCSCSGPQRPVQRQESSEINMLTVLTTAKWKFQEMYNLQAAMDSFCLSK